MYILLILLLLYFIRKYEYNGTVMFNKKAYWFVCTIFILMSGLRYRLGVDSVMYESDFSVYPTIDKYKWGYEYCRDANDVFWAILNSICKTVYNDFVSVQLVMGLVTNIVVFCFIKRHSSRPYLAVLFYFITLWPLITFEALREGMAVTFYIWALDALISGGGLLKYYKRVWPAVFFHSFGFMTLAFPLIQLLKPNKLTLIITIASAIAIISVGYTFGDLVMAYVELDSLAGDKMNMYFNSDTYGTNMWSIGGVLAIIIGYVLPIGAMAYCVTSSKNHSVKWLFPYLIFMLLVSLFKISLPVFYRFFNYYYLVLVIAMTECINQNNGYYNIWMKRMAKIAVFFFIFMVCYNFTKPVGTTKYASIYRYYPYNSIFTKDYNYKTEKLLPE